MSSWASAFMSNGSPKRLRSADCPIGFHCALLSGAHRRRMPDGHPAQAGQVLTALRAVAASIRRGLNDSRQVGLSSAQTDRRGGSTSMRGSAKAPMVLLGPTE